MTVKNGSVASLTFSISPSASKRNTHVNGKKVLFATCVCSLGTCQILSPSHYMYIVSIGGECLLPIGMALHCANWKPHCCTLCLTAVMLHSILFCYRHPVFPMWCCFATVILLCHVTKAKQHCFAFVMLHIICHCHAACFCHVSSLLSCYFASVMLLCLIQLSLSFCLA